MDIRIKLKILMNEIILKYIDRYYNLTLTDGYLFKNKLDEEKFLTTSEIYKELITIFSSNNFSEDEMRESVKRIILDKKKTLQALFDEYMCNCYPVLGITEWIIKRPDKTTITIDNVINDLKDLYGEDTIKYLFNIWFDDAIVRESERIMGTDSY